MPVVPGASEFRSISLSTKIAVIVFWGLILVGLVFAAILFHNLEASTQDSRESLADNIAYRIHETLDQGALEANANLSNELQLLAVQHPELHIELRHAGRVIAVSGKGPSDPQAQILERIIRVAQQNGERVSLGLTLRFPALSKTLHEQRAPLLIGLGILLLLFGSIMKALLDHILSQPLRNMVATARDISAGKADRNVCFDAERDDEFGYVSRFINEAVKKMRESREQAWEAKELAEVTLQSIGDGVITTDRQGKVVFMNAAVQQMLGFALGDARGKLLRDVMLLVDEGTGRELANPVIQCLVENRSVELENNCAILRSDDQLHPAEISVSPIYAEGGDVQGAVMVLHDVREARALQHELSYQASHDPLTGLYNRREFDRQLQRALDHTLRDGEEHALCYLDLDQFKVVNDTFGHTAGDALLRQLAEIVHARIRATDLLARLGGDEFGMLLERCNETRALEVAESIRGAIEGYRFEWQDSFTTVRCSIGVVMVSQEEADVASLMSSADVACYSAKDMGRNQVHLYRDSDASLRHEEMKWVSRISSAVEDNRLELYYQPIIGINRDRDNSRGHYELLLRMRDENGQLVSPDQFIPAAERYNLMSTLDRWVVKEALTELADRNAEGDARYTIAINLSGTSLSEDRFLADVIAELEKQKLPPGAVCFEITETAAISNLSRVVHFMQTLKKLGCKFSLDDFGSGLSSFTYLKNLPVDYLKIDGQFISNVADDNVDESMVKAISEVGHAMGIETIAERVETKKVLDKLGLLGIEFAQGYYIARPTSVTSFEPWSDHRFSQRRA